MFNTGQIIRERSTGRRFTVISISADHTSGVIIAEDDGEDRTLNYLDNLKMTIEEAEAQAAIDPMALYDAVDEVPDGEL